MTLVLLEIMCSLSGLLFSVTQLLPFMIYFCRCLFYSIRNLAYYREARGNPSATRSLLLRLESCDLQDMRDVITEFMLSGYGLKIVDGPQNQIPRGIWLTATQRDCHCQSESVRLRGRASLVVRFESIRG